MRRVIEAIADAGSLFPLRAQNAGNMITALARLQGRVTGFVANQPQHRAGVLDDQALAKELEFVELCDRFNIPLVFLHDTPGLMIGTDAERAGIAACYEKVVARIATCSVPKVGVVIRKSDGGGNFAMGGRPTNPDFLFAWPTAELGFMAPDAGVRTVHRRLLEQTRAAEGDEAEKELRRKLTGEWLHESEPWEAAARLYIDDVIDPRETRQVISAGIEFAWGSRRPLESEWKSSHA
jgi:acetyl-CoA carboxylase carboxyltransferase component